MCQSEKPEEALSFAQHFEIHLPQWNRSTLIAKACHHHNQRERQRAAKLDDLYAEIQILSPRSAETQLCRAAVNFLRWRCEQAQPRVAAWAGQSAFFEAQCVSKSRILNAIAEAYLWLASECARQDPLN